MRPAKRTLATAGTCERGAAEGMHVRSVALNINIKQVNYFLREAPPPSRRR